MNFTIEDISTSVLRMSLMGVYGEYPRGRGNYITVGEGDEENMENMFAVINVSCEDLEDAVALGLIGATMKAKVWRTPGRTSVAYVIDERLDSRARSCWYFYKCPPITAVAVMREVAQVPEGTCICAVPQFRRLALHGTHSYLRENGEITVGDCRECGESRRVEIIYESKE